MAEVVEEFPLGGGRGQAKYPWDLWLDGQIWKLEQGVDFDIEPPIMRSSANSNASKRNLRMKTVMKDKVLYIQATPK